MRAHTLIMRALPSPPAELFEINASLSFSDELGFFSCNGFFGGVETGLAILTLRFVIQDYHAFR